MDIQKATGVSMGIGIGRAVVIESAAPDPVRRQGEPEVEKIRLRRALEALTGDLRSRAAAAAPEQAEILESHVMLLTDPSLISEIEGNIERERVCAEHAAAAVLDAYIMTFQSSGDALLAARSADLRDIRDNLLLRLAGRAPFAPETLPAGSILVAEELSTSVAAGISAEIVSAIVTRLGGVTSHTAIIARSLGIPAVSGAEITGMEHGTRLIVDGTKGLVIFNPTPDRLAACEGERDTYRKHRESLMAYRGLPSVTRDGREIALCANIGLEQEIAAAAEADAEGVGLFRTEFLYMNSAAVLDEETQFSVYKKAAVAFGGKPVIIRTLDVGGDKALPALGIEKEENPFLGWRAIRYCLDREDVFRPQLRAILRASAFGCLRIMLPMISSLEELRRSRAVIEDVKGALQREGIAFDREIQTGIMVETPAAALLADALAQAADFFSIGTNDLTQYTLAVDRGNKKVAALYTAYHPAVLRLIYNTAQAAEKAGIFCGVCGEAGGDPRMIPFLIGCGVSELSMTVGAVLEARKIVRQSLSAELRRRVADELLHLRDTDDAISFLDALG